MRAFLCFVIAGLVFLHGSEVARAGGADFLAQNQWEKRIVLIFRSDLQDEALEGHKNYYVQYADGIKDRDTLMMYILMPETKEAITMIETLPEEYSLMPDPTETHSDLIAMYNPDFIDGRTVLIGKDGDVKGAWDSPPDIQQVFAVIDEMPMRIREMNENHSQK